MVAWRGEHHIGFRRQRVEPHPRMINRHADHIAAGQIERHPQAWIAGIFHHGGPPLIEQHLCSQPECVLSAHGDKDLLGFGLNATPGQGVERNILDQFRVVALVAVGGNRGKFPFSQRLQCTLPPVAVIEDPLVGLTVDERIRVSAPIHRFLRLRCGAVGET